MKSSFSITAAALGLLHSVAALQAKQTCIVESAKSATVDDTPAIKAAFAKCGTNGIIEFSNGINYNVFQPLEVLTLNNVQIRLLGNLSLPQDIPTVQKIVREAETSASGAALYSKLSWFRFGGRNLEWIGNERIDLGWINSYGQPWYDANKYPKTGLPDRPHLMSFNVSNAVLTHFKSMKPIGWNVQLLGENITVSKAIVDAVSTGPGFPFNTDGFGVTGKKVRISDSWIYNGDDAVAVQNGAEDVVFENSEIGWETHGMSIGSLGSDFNVAAKVSNILFNNITMKGGLYAARFKSWKGGKGLASNITWSNINIHNVTFPIFVTQLYFNQDLTKRTNGTSAVNMENFTWSNFTGTINDRNPGDGSCASNPCWYDVGYPALTHREAAIISCSNEQSCKNFKLENIKVAPFVKMQPSLICQNAMPALNPQLGIKCQNGTFEALPRQVSGSAVAKTQLM